MLYRCLAVVAVGAAVAIPVADAHASTPPDSTTDGEVTVISIEITDDGCPAAESSYDSGPFTFEIENVSGTGVTEFEVLEGDRILGEKENLPPGFSGSFSLDLGPGTYTLYCPGAATERTDIEVVGEALEAEPTDTGRHPPGRRRRLPRLRAQPRSTSWRRPSPRSTTRSKRATSRRASSPTSRRGPSTSASSRSPSRSSSASATSTRRSTCVPTTWRRRSSRASTASSTACGSTGRRTTSPTFRTQLVADVASLQELVDGLDSLQPYDLANGAVGLLDEAACCKITGEEERYSHIDLLDMAANVEGAEQAFAYLEEGLGAHRSRPCHDDQRALRRPRRGRRRTRSPRATEWVQTLRRGERRRDHRPVQCAPGRRRAALPGSATSAHRMMWSRRDVLGRLVLGGAGAAVAASTSPLGAARASAGAAPSSTADVVPFYGRHQAGIATPTQDRLAFAAFDVVTDDIDDRAANAGRLGRGRRPPHRRRGGRCRPRRTRSARLSTPARRSASSPRDSPSRSASDPRCSTKFGLAAHRPALLQALPTFRSDVLDPDLSHGDLCVQACSDDPQVAFHVVRNFARIGRGDRGDALVAARLRPNVGHQHDAVDAAQPDGFPGRHEQHQGRGRR